MWKEREIGRELVAMFIDLKAAFDSVVREGIGKEFRGEGE